jgi:hypothetical protein
MKIVLSVKPRSGNDSFEEFAFSFSQNKVLVVKYDNFFIKKKRSYDYFCSPYTSLNPAL